MPFSVHHGLSLMCLTMLLFPVAQGDCDKFLSDPVILECCLTTSNATIKEPVKACCRQNETTFSHCKVEAYIFITENNNKWCVDPRAWWIPQRLKKLAQRGIYCKPCQRPATAKMKMTDCDAP